MRKLKKSRRISSGKLKKMLQNPLQNPNSRFHTNIPLIETPIDELYGILKEKNLKVSTIMKKFDLKKEQALEWCEILTDRNLAKLEYPLFGEPVLRINID